jgi:hypothetical protein
LREVGGDKSREVGGGEQGDGAPDSLAERGYSAILRRHREHGDEAR